MKCLLFVVGSGIFYAFRKNSKWPSSRTTKILYMEVDTNATLNMKVVLASATVYVHILLYMLKMTVKTRLRNHLHLEHDSPIYLMIMINIVINSK